LESLKEAAPDFIHYIGDFTGMSNYFIDTLYYQGIIADERNLFVKFTAESNNTGRFQSLINLATAYREMGDHRRAAFYAARGCEIMVEIGRYPFWYLAAEEYGVAGMEDSCFHYHRLALGELPKATRIKVATTYQQIAESHLAFHRPDSALKYMELAFALTKAMNNRLTVAAMHADLAKIYASLGQPERAEQHLNEGVRLAKQVSVKHTSTLYAFGRDFYSARNDPARALSYARLHQQLADSINRNENAVELIRFQAQLETSRKERELEATRLTLRNRTITVVSLAAIAILSVSFVVVLFLQQRRIKRQNIQLNERNQEQRTLVQEIHHRVKNNLQYIVSLLNLQAQTAQTEDLATQIEEIKNRIMTMAVIHQRLYQVQGVHRVEVGPFVNELLTNVLNALPSRTPIARTLHIEPMQLDVDTAISLGLLINELMTNAVKHAFVHHTAPEASLSIVRDGSGLMLRVRDNGPGFHFPGNGNGFGMRLIQLLIRKLKGQLTQPDPNTLEIRMAIVTS
jgi:two-component sensor histidine kinase